MKHVKRSCHMVSYAQCNACRPVDLFAPSRVRHFQNQSIPPTPFEQEHAVNSVNMLQRLSSRWMCTCRRTVGIPFRCTTWQCSSQQRPPHEKVVAARRSPSPSHRNSTSPIRCLPIRDLRRCTINRATCFLFHQFQDYALNFLATHALHGPMIEAEEIPRGGVSQVSNQD